METETIFREIDSLISFTEAMQGDLSASTFDKLKIVDDKLTFFRSGAIQCWVEGKSAALFQFARTLNRKAKKFSESYVDFIKPVSRGSYTPVGVDIDDR